MLVHLLMSHSDLAYFAFRHTGFPPAHWLGGLAGSRGLEIRPHTPLRASAHTDSSLPYSLDIFLKVAQSRSQLHLSCCLSGPMLGLDGGASPHPSSSHGHPGVSASMGTGHREKPATILAPQRAQAQAQGRLGQNEPRAGHELLTQQRGWLPAPLSRSNIPAPTLLKCWQ